VILVAHRLTTLRDTDRIFVFDDGRVVESGTFAELSVRGGVFTDLLCHGAGALTSPPAGSPGADGARLGGTVVYAGAAGAPHSDRG
jgi:ATP-binding cassette subfamily B protein